MSMIMKRVERLESKHAGKELFDEILIQIIRPGDMACVAEHRIDLKSGKRTITRFDEGAP